MSQLLTYSRFYAPEDAGVLIELLRNDGIEFEIDEEEPNIKVYLGESLDPMVALKIPQEKFQRANDLFAGIAIATTEENDPGYYLFTFSNEELISVINHPGEWNVFDRSLAEKILRKRGISFVLENPGRQIYQAEQLPKKWIIIGYIVSVFAMYGLCYGFSILHGTKTLSSGEVVPIYDKKSQRHGDLMTVIAMISTIYFFFKIFRELILKEQIFYIDYSAFVIT